MREEECTNCDDPITECECGDTEGYSSDGAICPYCGNSHDPADDNHSLYDQDCESFTCQSCRKVFNVDLYISYSWMTAKSGD